MVHFRPQAREIIVKIVYYGPPLGGKTTNLRTLYQGYPASTRGELVVVPAGGDRTIFFDFLPMDAGQLRGMRLRVQLYTVPGQVHYNATRQVVLRGVDGVVFVADSQREMMRANKESWENLKENLLLQGLALHDLPHVLQYNKRDLSDIAELEEIDKLVNEYSAPFFEAVASQGIGVEETLQGVVKLVARSLRERFRVGADAGLPGAMDLALAPPPAPTPTPEPVAAAAGDGGARVFPFAAGTGGGAAAGAVPAVAPPQPAPPMHPEGEAATFGDVFIADAPPAEPAVREDEITQKIRVVPLAPMEMPPLAALDDPFAEAMPAAAAAPLDGRAMAAAVPVLGDDVFELAVPEPEPASEPAPEPVFAEPLPAAAEEQALQETAFAAPGGEPAAEAEPEMVFEEAREAAAPETAPPINVPLPGESVAAIQRVVPRALAQYGEVRELEIEVPVPAVWVGGKRMTLQLRLTLVPQEEDHGG